MRSRAKGTGLGNNDGVTRVGMNQGRQNHCLYGRYCMRPHNLGGEDSFHYNSPLSGRQPAPTVDINEASEEQQEHAGHSGTHKDHLFAGCCFPAPSISNGFISASRLSCYIFL